jgi:hypothetical protein
MVGRYFRRGFCLDSELHIVDNEIYLDAPRLTANN